MTHQKLLARRGDEAYISVCYPSISHPQDARAALSAPRPVSGGHRVVQQHNRPFAGVVAMDGLLRSLLKCVRRRLRTDEPLTVEAVTHEMGYTRQYVSGRFHRATGRLLSHFLKEKRLEKAAKLLKRGNQRVTQIARRCGFESENYFRQQFRERFGMSPRQFRADGNLRKLSKRVA